MAIYLANSPIPWQSAYASTPAGIRQLSALYAPAQDQLLRIYPTLTLGSGMAVFVNTDYHGKEDNNENESRNVRDTLTRNGITDFTVFGDISSTGFATALRGKRRLLIPELEHGNLLADLSHGALALVRDFVRQGGHVLLFYLSTCTVPLMQAFGMQIDSAAINGDIIRDADAKLPGLPATLPGSLKNPSATGGLKITAPSDAKGYTVLYKDSLNNAAVLSFAYGQGRVSYLGWDWFGKNDSEWEAVLLGLLQI